MVTLPTEAAEQPDLVSRMTVSGMDIARVNCAHDEPVLWQRMIDNVRGTKRPNGHRPRIAMDLGGPKLRTGPLQPVRVPYASRPERDALGVVTVPALAWLTADPETCCRAATSRQSCQSRTRAGSSVGVWETESNLSTAAAPIRHWVVVEVPSRGLPGDGEADRLRVHRSQALLPDGCRGGCRRDRRAARGRAGPSCRPRRPPHPHPQPRTRHTHPRRQRPPDRLHPSRGLRASQARRARLARRRQDRRESCYG